MALFTDKCVRLCELGLGVINYETKLTILDVFLILQEYVNHGAVLYKVYVCGSRVWISSPRASIPDYVDYHPMNTATSRNTIVLDNGSLGSKKMRMGHVDQVPSSFT